jgi:hypothetical protein
VSDFEDENPSPMNNPRRRPTLWQRIEAVEALLGIVFAIILTCVFGLAGVALVAQSIYQFGRSGSYPALAGGVGLLMIFVMQYRFALSLDQDSGGDVSTVTPAIIAARIRRGSIIRRLFVAVWAAALALALLLFAHTWADLYRVRGNGFGPWVASAIGAAILFVGAFASNAAIVSSLAALGVSSRLLERLWGHRYLFDALFAIGGTILADLWTGDGNWRILP